VRCSESQRCPRKREVKYLSFISTISHVSVSGYLPFVILSGQLQNRSLHMMSFYAQSGILYRSVVRGCGRPPLRDPCPRCQSVYRDEPRLGLGPSGAAAQSLPPAKKATILFSFSFLSNTFPPLRSSPKGVISLLRPRPIRSCQALSTLNYHQQLNNPYEREHGCSRWYPNQSPQCHRLPAN
jgi:hypothetical protein